MKMRRPVLTFVAILVLGVPAAAFWWPEGADPAVAELQRMRERARDESLSDEDRRDLYREMRERERGLTDAQRAVLDAERDERRMAGFERHVDTFLAMSPEERDTHLDEVIDRMENWRKEMEQRRAQRPPRESGSAGGSGGSGGPGGRGGDGRGMGGRGGPRGINATFEQRQDRRRNMLDRTSPERRAKFAEYSRSLNKRRAQRGLPTSDWFGGGGGRGGRG